MEKVVTEETKVQVLECPEEKSAKSGKDNEKKWEKPTLENVSKEVMAQPYIRFT